MGSPAQSYDVPASILGTPVMQWHRFRVEVDAAAAIAIVYVDDVEAARAPFRAKLAKIKNPVLSIGTLHVDSASPALSLRYDDVWCDLD